MEVNKNKNDDRNDVCRFRKAMYKEEMEIKDIISVWKSRKSRQSKREGTSFS